MTRSKEVFSPQAQALDLCIRLTSCPIFSLPPPQFLINYFRKKYGSAARDDNPNTMIEEGITNDPRPRRPPMLVGQSTSTRRNSNYVFGPGYQERNASTYSSFEIDEDRCKRYLDEEVNIGTTSSLDTAAETSPKLRPLTKLPTLNLKESKASTEGSKDEAMISSLSISAPTDRSSTPDSEEIAMGTHLPSSFAPGIALELNEKEETALAARKISRRLTMEGRKDNLDFLNITGLMRRSHCPTMGQGQKSTASIGLGTRPGSHPPLPASISETNFSPSRHYGDIRERSVQSTALRRGRGNLSVISDGSIVEDEDKVGLDSKISEDHLYTHTIVDVEAPEQEQKDLSDSQLVMDMEQYDTQMDTSSDCASSHHPMICRSDSEATEQQQQQKKKNDSSSDSSSKPINKKMSMDNLRRMSRDALTRFQEGVFGASVSLSNSTTTGPLSPTILRAERESYGFDAKPTTTTTTSTTLPTQQLSGDDDHV
ncbi:hypothetical protein BGX21_003261 [Mortierella sp. AD011]|nr:hypothetical protein BGX21_003261 [Mortierella sp. AD011]